MTASLPSLSAEERWEMVDYGHRVALLRASVPERIAWRAGVLARHPPRPIRLSLPDQAALEAVMAGLAGSPIRARILAAVGRAAAVGYERYRADPVVTIAFPLLTHPLYRGAVRRLMQDIWAWAADGYRAFEKDVDAAVEALLRTAPGRLTVPELAFALLGTLHRLADPAGSRWARALLEGRG